MIAKAENGSGGDFTIAPAGNHAARCVRVIDLGTQQKVWNGKAKLQRTVAIAWELPNETHTFKEEKGPEPFMVWRRFALSLYRSSLLDVLQDWTGRTFSEEECNAGFDLKKLMDRPCMVNVIHNDKYANVGSVAPIPKGTVCPPRVSPLVFFSLEKGEFSQEVFESLHEKLQETIKKSPEWSALKGDQHQVDDDIPF